MNSSFQRVRSIPIALVFLSIFLLASKEKIAMAEEMTPVQILALADKARGNIAGIEWETSIESIVNKRNKSKTMRIKAKGANCLVEFTAPRKVKGRKLLMVGRNMWFVKPGLRKPVPISPKQRLLGNAANGDIASTNYAGDYIPVSMTDDLIDGEPCYVLDLDAVNIKVTYDKIRYWISKDRQLGIKAEFFTRSGKLLKTAVFEYANTIKTPISTRPFVSKMIITDALVASNVTILNYRAVKLKKIPDSTFNINLLLR